MKKILLHSAYVISINSQAKIWRVNNNGDIIADFTSLATAVPYMPDCCNSFFNKCCKYLYGHYQSGTIIVNQEIIKQ